MLVGGVLVGGVLVGGVLVGVLVAATAAAGDEATGDESLAAEVDPDGSPCAADDAGAYMAADCSKYSWHRTSNRETKPLLFLWWRRWC